MTTQNNSMFMALETMDKAYKYAEIISKADIIPIHYRGKPANVFLAVQTALRLNLDPMLVMQNTYIISGKLGMNTTFALALANKSELFELGIRYRIEGSGDDLEVTAYAALKDKDEKIAFTVTMRQAIAEGWVKNPKYKSLPELMLRYRAATLLIRTHAPEVLNGLHMVEELQDVTASKQLDNSSCIMEKVNKLAHPTSEEIIETPQDLSEKLEQLILRHKVSKEIVDKWLQKAGVDHTVELPSSVLESCIEYIQHKY